MARRGNNCRCCVCQTYGIVESPLVRQGDHYSQQTPNGKGPFRLDLGSEGGLWLTISEVVASALRATTLGKPLRLTGIHPVGVSITGAWHPVTVAANGVVANTNNFAAGSQPAHLAGNVSVIIPQAPTAALEAYLELFTLPAECAVPYYGNVPLSVIFSPGRSPTEAEYPYPLNVFDILPFGVAGTGAELNNTTGAYKKLVSLDKFQPLPRNGIEAFWVPREGIGGLNVIPIGSKDDPPPLLRYSSFFFIRLGTQSRWVVGSESLWDGEQFARPVSLFRSGYTLSVITQPEGGDERSASPPLVTAHAFRGGEVYITAGPGDLGIQYAPGRSALASPGFTNAAPISVGGQLVTVIRNGQSVLKEVRPTAQHLQMEMEKEGTYLIISDVTEATDPPGHARVNGVGQYGSQWLRQYGSLVVDTTPPLVGFVPLDDAYIDRFFGSFPTFPNLIGLFSSEPINIDPARQRFGLNTKEPVALPLQPGDYTLAAYFTDEVADRAGNPPATSGLQPIRLLPVPALPMRRGARGALKLPREDCLGTHTEAFQHGLFFFNGIFYPNGLYHYGGQAQTFARRTAMPYVDLEFPQRGGERRYKIVNDNDAIKGSQFALMKNGQVVSAEITVERITDSRFRVYVPASAQPAGSVMFLTWTPDEDALSECIERQSFPTRADFPPHKDASNLLVYVAEDTGDVFEKGQTDYIAYAPEASVCAARTSWIVLPETSPLELIDTSSTVSLIGRHVSVSETAPGLTIGRGTTEVQSEQGMYLPVGLVSNDAAVSPDQRVTGVGQWSDTVAEGFVPQVPAALPAQSPARCSYFGLSTTIDPCPPGFVSPCAGPSVAQKHSSVIRSTQDIQQLEIQLVNIEDGIEKLDKPLLGTPSILNPSVRDYRDPAQYNAVPDIMVMSKDPYVFSATSSGKLSSQNTWFCTDGERDRDDGALTAPAYSEGIFVNGVPVNSFSSRENRLAEAQHEIRINESVVPFWAFAENVRFGDLWDGVPIPVQYWRKGRNGLLVNTPEPIVRKAKGDIWQGGMQASASAYRMARTYGGMGTATLSELVLDMSWRMTASSAVTFTDRRYPLPRYISTGNLENPPDEDIDQGWITVGGLANGIDFTPNAPGGIDGDTLGTFARALAVPKPKLFDSLPFVAEKKDVIRRGWLTLSHTIVFSDEKEQALAAGETVVLPGPPQQPGVMRNYRWKIRRV